MRVWDTFVSDQNNFFLAVTYAADNGVKVIEGADRRPVPLDVRRAGVALRLREGTFLAIYSGDDLNTGNHNYPAAYNHAMLVQGVSADAEGLGEELRQAATARQLLIACDSSALGTTVPVGTYFRNCEHHPVRRASPRSRCTAATGSTNTGKASGAAGLIASYGAQRAGLVAWSRTSCAR